MSSTTDATTSAAGAILGAQRSSCSRARAAIERTASSGKRKDHEQHDERRDERGVVEQQQEDLRRVAVSRFDDRRDRGEIRDGGRQLDRHDPRAEEPGRAPARLLASAPAVRRRARGRATARPPRAGRRRLPRARSRAPCAGSACSRASASAWPGPKVRASPPASETAKTPSAKPATSRRPCGPTREEEGRRERRRIQRVGGADRDDEGDEGEHPPSLTHAVR